jgi:hypothetical protein
VDSNLNYAERALIEGVSSRSASKVDLFEEEYLTAPLPRRKKLRLMTYIKRY